MKIALAGRLQKQIERIPQPLLEDFLAAVDQLPGSFGKPHAHLGLGIRKIHPRGVYEFRVGKRQRVVFTRPQPDLLMLHILGDHDEVQRFLDTL